MPYNMRTPDNGAQAAHTYPVTRSLAFLLLGAFILLILLRHFFGAIRVEAGTK